MFRFLYQQPIKKEHKGNCPIVPQGPDSVGVSRVPNFLGFAYSVTPSLCYGCDRYLPVALRVLPIWHTQ